MMDILFFGRLSDVSKPLSIERPAGVTDIESLKHWLGQQNEVLIKALEQTGVRVAVNKAIVSENVPLTGDEEIAFMSVLSGG